jgi:hypothetical protein
MGTLVRILLGLLAIAGFCIIMDLITLLYEYAWVIPAIIGAIFLIRFIVRPDFRAKVFSVIVGKRDRNYVLPTQRKTNPQEEVIVEDLINDLIDLAIVDGELSERERRNIVMKAAEMGLSPEETEVIIEKKLRK